MRSVKVETRGRLVVALALREALGIKPDDTLFAETEGYQILRYVKASNPFDVLAEDAIAQRTAGHTKNLRKFAAKHDVDLDSD